VTPRAAQEETVIRAADNQLVPVDSLFADSDVTVVVLSRHIGA
jgi:hypothetical protein